MPARTLAGFAAAVAAILIAVTAYVVVVADRDRKAAHVSDRSETVLSLQRLEDALARAESGQRGYLLTREEGYLETYRRAAADIHAELDTVRRRDPHVRADALVALVEAKLAELRRGVEVREADGLARAQRELRSGNGAWLSETIEAVRAELESRERTALGEHRRAWFERVALADAIFLAANVVLLALVTGAGLAARAEMRRREERAQERLRMLELQERILGIVSHDLRSPLAAIQGGAALLSRSRLAPEQVRIASLVLSSSRRMERIIRDLLDYTRTRARGGIPLSIRETDAGDVCARVVEEAVLSGLGAVQLRRDGDLSGEWDPDRLEQAIGNLVANGIQHAPPGTPVRVRAIGEEDRVRIEVENDGPPIPPDAVRSLFDPFQGPSPASRGGRAGLGLGLFIVRTIVEAHGGTVDVELAAARPVVFVVRLPRTPRDARRGTPAPTMWRPTRPEDARPGASAA